MYNWFSERSRNIYERTLQIINHSNPRWKQYEVKSEFIIVLT